MNLHPYSFLKQYIRGFNPIKGTVINLWNTNRFMTVPKEDIKAAEKELGFPFPTQLKEFYEEIGYGCLTTPHNPGKDYVFYSSNEILPPLAVAHFYKGIAPYNRAKRRSVKLW